MSDWQPISTAPKDGVVVLTIHEDDLYPQCAFHMGVWMRQTEGPEDMHGPGKWEPLYRTPTHWMPLPEPPNP